MKVFFILIGDISYPSPRERVIKYLAELTRCGYRYSLHIVGNVRPGILGKLIYYYKLLVESLSSSIIFINRVPLLQSEIRLIRLLNPNIIFDFDDAIYTGMGLETDIKAIRTRRDRFEYIMRNSKLIIAGNRTLAAYAKLFTSEPLIIPTYVDEELFHPGPPKETNGPVIGWTGRSVNFMYLKQIDVALRRVCQRFPNVVLRIVSDSPLELAGVNISNKQWLLDQEPHQIRTFDIGIMPLADDEWARGKCAFKALIYMACGLPVVLSPVGMNTEIITDGVEGFFASTQQEWFEKLSMLIQDERLRKRMGIAARRRVESFYSKRIGLQALLYAFQRCLD